MADLRPTVTDPGALLADLERVRDVRGTLPLFDALVARDPGRVQGALATWPNHPARASVEAWLVENGHVAPVAEGPAAALARHGITDVEAWLQRVEVERSGLIRVADSLRTERDTALKSSNAYALVATVLALVAIGGWLLALGVPEPEVPEQEVSGAR